MAILNGDLATTRKAGLIRVSTNAEAQSGAAVVAAITPAQLQAAVNAGVGQIVGVLTYRGLFDPTTIGGSPDLSNALKGDFYKVSRAGEFLGLDLNVNDNIIVNADMGGVINVAKIDVIDNTESIIFLDDLHDVAVTDAATGQFLRFDGDEWSAATIAQGEVSGLVSALSDLQGELDRVETSVGLNGDGTKANFASVNYITNAMSLKGAVEALDGAVKAVENTVENTLLSQLEDVQDELDLTQQSAGLQADGSLVAFNGASYIEGAANLRAAISTLDTQLYNNVVALSETDDALQEELDLAESIVGLAANGGLVPFVNVGVVAGQGTFRSAIDALSIEAADIRGLVVGGVDDINEKLGVVAGEDLVFAGTFSLEGATTFLEGVEALDAALRIESAARVSADTTHASDISDLFDASAATDAVVAQVNESVGLTAGGTLIPFTLTGVVAGKTSFLAAADALSVELDEVRGLVVGGVDELNDKLGTTAGEDFTFVGTFAIDGVSTFAGAVEALDSALRSESEARYSGDETLTGLITGLADKFGEKPAHVVYVSGEYGDDSYGGSLYEPKRTIAGALTSIPNNGSLAQVFVFPGVYSENITLARTNTVLSGLSPTGRGGHTSIINGSIDIAPSFSAGGLFNNQISIENFLINKTGANPCINLGGTFVYVCNVRNCQLFTDNADAGSLVKNTTALQARLQFTNCSLNHSGTGDNHTVELSAGSLFIDGCEVYRVNGSSSSRAIKLSGTATCPRITSLLCTVSNCAYAVESSVAIALGNSVIGNSTANGTGIYMSAGICTALYTTFDVAVGTGHVVDGAIGSAYIYAYNTYINDVTVGANIFKVALAGSLPAGLSQVAYSGLAEDVVVAHTAANFTVAAQDAESFFVGVDEKFGDIDTAIAAAGKVESVNGVAPAEGSKDVLISAADIAATITPSNYAALSSDPISVHLSAIDGELGDLATAVAAAGKVETVNGVAPAEGSKDVLISAADIAATFTPSNYTALSSDPISTHLSAIDGELGERLRSVNGVSGLDITINASTIIAPYDAENYTASSIESITAHLTAIDAEFGGLSDVAFSGNYSDLLNVPTNNINQVIIDSTANNVALSAGRHYLFSVATGATKYVDVPSLVEEVSDGDYIRVTNYGNGTVVFREVSDVAYILDGNMVEGGVQAGSFSLSANATVDLYGFKRPPTNPVVWLAYFNSNIKTDATTAVDGGLAYFDQATQSIKFLTSALADVATSGEAADLAVANAAINFTAATLTAQAFFDGIDERLGDLSLASSVAATFTPANYTTASSFVSAHLVGIDTKLGQIAVGAGDQYDLQLSDGSGGLTAAEWSINASNHLLPATDGLYDLGSAANQLRAAYITAVKLGSSNLDLSVDGDSNLVFNGNAVKAIGAPLIDSIIETTATNITLAKNAFYSVSNSGTATFTLPAAPIEGNVIYLQFQASPTITVASSSANIMGGVSSVVFTGQGNQIVLAYDGATTKWLYWQAKRAEVFGLTQNFSAVTASTTAAVGVEYLVNNTAAAAVISLPLLSTLTAGDRIRVQRGWLSTKGVSVSPNAGDAGANVFRSSKRGYSSSVAITGRGELSTFVVSADKTKWEVKEEYFGLSVISLNTTPAVIENADVIVRLSNLGNTVAYLPEVSGVNDGAMVRLVAEGDRTITVSVAEADSGSTSVVVGSTNGGDSTSFPMTDGRTIACYYDKTNNEWLIEPPFGTAAAFDVGTAAGNIVQLDGSARLPAIDGSLLTGIATGSGRLAFSKETTSFTAVKMTHHSVDTTGGAVVATLPALAAVDEGDTLRVRLTVKGGTNTVSVVGTINGAASPIILTVVGESAEFLANKTDNVWEVL